MFDVEIRKSAEMLFDAYKESKPIAYGRLPIITEQDGYDVQDAVNYLKFRHGEKVAGYKISLSGKLQRAFFNTDTPLYGEMTDASVVKGEISLQDYIEPLLEFELVFLVDETIHVTDSAETIMRKCRIAAGFEIPDSRFADWYGNISKFELEADGAANAALVYGEGRSCSYDDIDNLFGQVTHNGEAYAEGSSIEIMGHPVNAVQWLAEILDERGKEIQAGMFVSSGAVNMPKVITPGQYVGQFEGLPSVSLQVNA
ncbi:hydratase [Aerococcus agrisoli]|uniref:Hydratase n=1 Tax=Aerococcus agrisoli TaxID=2487350 RepID=A0A3N4GTJ9_9LACT|nr:hydratase [Aerococcus agrisoli]RPA62411.1 hydratase [Aerococcus agrisoli]